MVSPVSFNSNPRVYFRGENDNLFSAPGRFTMAEDKGDQVDISAKAAEEELADEPKKSKTGKIIGAVVGTLVGLTAASFGLFKWKGAKWLAPEQKGSMATIKKWLVKPGEFVDNQIIKKIGKLFSKKDKKVDPEPEIKPDSQQGGGPTSGPEGGGTPDGGEILMGA